MTIKWIGELKEPVGERWLRGYMVQHHIPDLALELVEDRLIAHAVYTE